MPLPPCPPMQEVEKDGGDDERGGGSGGRGRSRQAPPSVSLEYVYDADAEPAYARSLSKAAAKAMEEARYPFLIVDAPHVRVDDFRDVWTAAQ
eukprot:291402-Chlamydomonas_euryale.AAC.1